jgi:hypothetical protein
LRGKRLERLEDLLRGMAVEVASLACLRAMTISQAKLEKV